MAPREHFFDPTTRTFIPVGSTTNNPHDPTSEEKKDARRRVAIDRWDRSLCELEVDQLALLPSWLVPPSQKIQVESYRARQRRSNQTCQDSLGLYRHQSTLPEWVIQIIKWDEEEGQASTTDTSTPGQMKANQDSPRPNHGLSGREKSKPRAKESTQNKRPEDSREFRLGLRLGTAIRSDITEITTKTIRGALLDLLEGDHTLLAPLEFLINHPTFTNLYTDPSHATRIALSDSLLQECDAFFNTQTLLRLQLFLEGFISSHP